MSEEISKPKRILFLALGWISLALGFIGVFLPVVPTVPFLIVAAYFFSTASKKMHRWLRHHPKFGKAISAWEDHGIIPRKAKVMGTFLVSISTAYMIFFLEIPPLVKATILATIIGAFIFIWTRPEHANEE